MRSLRNCRAQVHKAYDSCHRAADIGARARALLSTIERVIVPAGAALARVATGRTGDNTVEAAENAITPLEKSAPQLMAVVDKD